MHWILQVLSLTVSWLDAVSSWRFLMAAKQPHKNNKTPGSQCIQPTVLYHIVTWTQIYFHTHTHTHTHRHRALIGAGRWKEALNYKSWWSHKTSIKYPTYPLNTAFTLFHPIQPSISPCIHNYIHTHADTLCLYFNRITFKTFPLKQ